MIGIAITFWLAVLAILYAYVGYPALLWLLSRFKRLDESSRVQHGSRLPSVSLLISAYNEEKVIGEKIRKCAFARLSARSCWRSSSCRTVPQTEPARLSCDSQTKASC